MSDDAYVPLQRRRITLGKGYEGEVQEAPLGRLGAWPRDAQGTRAADPGPIQRFADSGIQQAIDGALSGLSEDKHGAVVAFVDKDAAHLAAVARMGEHWSVVGVLDKPFHGSIEGQAAVRFSW